MVFDDGVVSEVPSRMKQVAQNFRSGKISVLDVPTPQLRHGGVLVRTVASVVSAGTERSKVILAKKNMFAKAYSRPDQVRKVLAQMKRDGVRGGLTKAFNKLNAYSPMGYSLAGEVIAVGPGVSGLAVGDRVACAGATYANHAQIVFVPKNLVVPVPEGLAMDEAAFGTIGAIALQGVRQAEASLGERVAVIGLGLVGLLTVQLLRVSGAVVVGIEPREDRRILGASYGAAAVWHPEEVSEGLVRGLTSGIGFDAVIVTAASSSPQLLNTAAKMLRDRGRVVVVGDCPIVADRETFYRKEIELRLSRSYGPGRYDRQYEDGGRDYPVGYVRWTEQRNMAEIVRLLAEGSVDVRSLISEELTVNDAQRGYETLEKGSILALVLRYPDSYVSSHQPVTRLREPNSSTNLPNAKAALGISAVGAGSYLTGVLLPALRSFHSIVLRGVVSASGLSAQDVSARWGFAYSTRSMEDVLADVESHAIIIATPHNEHANQVHRGLSAGRAIFVEKPLAMSRDELKLIVDGLAVNDRLMVGYNRRFSRHARLLRTAFAARTGTALVTIRVNAGYIAPDHWIQDPSVGGGRIVGEVCHFVDLAQFLTGSPVAYASTYPVGHKDPDRYLQDNLSVVLTHRDGSITTVMYTSKGDPTSGKELIEMFADGVYGVIQDFKESRVSMSGKVRQVRGADKGQTEMLRQWIKALENGSQSPIAPADLLSSASATLSIVESLTWGRPAEVTSWI